MIDLNESSNITPEEFDLVVIESAEGSKLLAWTLARKGQRVAMIEQRWIGGSCPNIACLPSKNIIHAAKVASYFSRAEEFGIRSAGYSVDMAAVTGRKRKMVKELDIVYDTLGGAVWDASFCSVKRYSGLVVSCLG